MVYSLRPMFIFDQAGALCQWTADSQRMILEYFDMINVSPSHIYCSALKFSPSSSWLHQYYGGGLSQEVKVVRGLSAGWGTCFRIVSLDDRPVSLACWKDTIAVGSDSGYIVTLNAITGSKIAVLSGHTYRVKSLSFSLDGTMLVSGGDDTTIKLWDMQTGGVAKTFHGHTERITSVSISPNCTTIASGSIDETIHLWDIQTGECYCVIQQGSWADYDCVHFFPLDPHHFISVANKVQKWNTDGCKIGPEYDGYSATFSFDGTKLALCNKGVVQVQSSDSGAVIAEFHMAQASHCCLSLDGRLVAVSDGYTVYVWDITSSEPSLIETFIGHTDYIIPLEFSSPTSLISTSHDQSVRFWQISASSTPPDVIDPKSAPHTSPIKSITLQAKDGIAISSDSDGVVRIWDLSTGLCKTSLQTPAKSSYLRDVRLIDNRLVLVWSTDRGIYIWDVEKGKLLQTVQTVQTVDAWYAVFDLKISGDGSKVFYMDNQSIQAWHIWTGEVVGKVKLSSHYYTGTFLTVDSSKVWVQAPGQYLEGWDFGVPEESSIKHYKEPLSRPHLDFIGGRVRKWRSYLPGIEDTITGREVLQLPSRYKRPNDAQWDGQYLVAGYETGEVIILDCNYMLAH